jgi:hypothetical protein
MNDVLAEYRDSNVSYFAYARHALVEALRLSGISHGDRVALPGFICRDVLASLHVLGATPTFYEVDESLRPVALDSLTATKAIIAVDYFGFEQDLLPVRSYCERTGARLIEDNAHGLFSKDRSGQLLGTRGDFGILSMRKTFHLASGGALLTRDEPGISMPCINRSEGAHGLRYTLSRFERKTSIPVFAAMRSSIRIARRLTGRRPITTGSADDETVLPTPIAIGCRSLDRLNAQDARTESERRRRLYDEVARDLQQVPGVHLLHRQLDVNCVPYGVPFRIVGQPDSALRHVERRHHVVIMQWPSLAGVIADSAPGHYTNVWLVNFL